MASPLQIPSGLGLKRTDLSSGDLMDKLLIWEPPRKQHEYVMAVDVSDGIQQDWSVIDIIRVGTVEEPEEQVAQFVTNSIDPIALAAYCDVIGRFYSDRDGMEAMAAIETNNHGIATQSELQNHYGYRNFYIWQYEDAANPSRRFSQAYGWQTTRRTRPIILIRLVSALKTVDPTTGKRDLILNSPFTREQLKDFHSDGALWEAEAVEGALDDCVMTAAIGLHVASTLHLGETEPLHEKRRRIAEEKKRQQEYAEDRGLRRDYQSTDMSVDEMEEDYY